MTPRNALALLLLSVTAFSTAAATEPTLTATQIIAQANLAAFYPGKDGRSQARMKIVDANGNRQLRQFSILRRNVSRGGDQQLLVLFSRPADVRGTVFRVEKHIDGNDDRWLYLPSLDLLRRISAGDKRSSFVGSDFFYEDVSGRSPSADNFTLDKSDPDSYWLTAVPKDPNDVEFGHYQVQIDKATMLPLQTDYFDDHGQHYRRIRAVKIGTINGHPTVLRSKVEDLRRGGYTLLEFRGVEYDLGLEPALFSERTMRHVPKAYQR
ncbi:outer membrane lipoprotein-sorting protein [uncultured Ferrimonas sp.]|uniref:outer membrane lipoprotein-sorting protein n=1 Tax=uncultured Ferrimonas sp. TaxID=432640 RepID=UPI002608A2ED|nr:outer membrane lipoprotein-sorting protein [uncultured Ferrimonas sp.]